MERARVEGRYFLPIVIEKRRSPVPSGMRDALLAEYKLELIQRMKRSYDILLPRLQPFFQTVPNDQAYALLHAYQDQIDGYFDDTKLQLFQGIVDMSYEGKILSVEHYQSFCAWIKAVRQQMSDDPREEGNITRVFYGFAYDDGGILRYVIDGQKMRIVEKRDDLRIKEFITTPIIKRQYAMKQSCEIGDARQAFREWLRQVQDVAFVQLVKILHAMDGVIDKQSLRGIADDIGNQTSEVLDVIQYFNAIWNGRKMSDKCCARHDG